MITTQMKAWDGIAGKEYTNRHTHSLMEWEQMYVDKFGFTRTEMNSIFLDNLDRDIKILEVGCNMGNQLLILQKMGFRNLYGIELQDYAVEMAKQRTKGINIIKGSAFDIPFKNGFFDMVFTSTVLIHFNLSDVKLVMDEIYRCSSRYIWGFEYYNRDFVEIIWRGLANMMWKADYVKLYTERFNLKLLNEKSWKYIVDDNVDNMFLLEKAGV